MELMKNTAFMELNDSEMNEVNGGGFGTWLAGVVGGYFIGHRRNFLLQ